MTTSASPSGATPPGRPRKSRRKVILLVVSLVILLAVGIGIWIGYLAFLVPSISTDKTHFYVYTGESYSQVMERIDKEDVVKNFTMFEYVARAMDLEESGIRAGKYRIDHTMSNRIFVGNLRGGYQDAVSFQFQNIRLKENFAGLLGQNFETDSATFLSMLNDQQVAEKYGFNTDSFFGMFIPNTYEIYWNTEPTKIFDRFHDEYNKFWTAERKGKADSLGLTTQEVSTLAAIVKGEAMHVDEMPRIAGLYMNRLEKGMLLQADPTVIFANNDFTIRRVLNRHLTIDNPYNTYRFKGLPPGPIMMPSIASIDAVLDHEHNEYIYMCAKDDFSGYHLFATTMAEHLVNARKFQRALDERNIMK